LPRRASIDKPILESLVIPLAMLVIDEFLEGPSKAALAERHHSIEALVCDRPYEPFGIGVRIGRLKRRLHDLHPRIAQDYFVVVVFQGESRAGRVPGCYLPTARLLTPGCLTARSASRSRPRVTSIAVFTLPTNGTAFSPVSAVPLSHPFCRIAAPSVASAIAVPKNGIERPIRCDSRAPPQRAMVRPMLMSVLGARAVPLRTIAAIWPWAAAAVGKTVQRVETIRRSTFRPWPFLWSSLASQRVLLARKRRIVSQMWAERCARLAPIVTPLVRSSSTSRRAADADGSRPRVAPSHPHRSPILESLVIPLAMAVIDKLLECPSEMVLAQGAFYHRFKGARRK
jgi:hypothetical protein